MREGRNVQSSWAQGPGCPVGHLWGSGPRHPGTEAQSTNAWGRHGAGTTSKWTSLFPGSVLPLENAWPHWQPPHQWHSWSPPLTATTRSPSSTPKPPGRGLVSTIHQRSSLMRLEECRGREKARKARTAAPALLVHMVWEGPGGQNWPRVTGLHLAGKVGTSKFFVIFRLWFPLLWKEETVQLISTSLAS